jgi:hypothetical protein
VPLVMTYHRNQLRGGMRAGSLVNSPSISLKMIRDRRPSAA